MLALLLCSGCAHVARKTGVAGWFTVDEASGLDYARRLAPIEVAGDSGCAALHELHGSQVVVLVHGVKGDGTEMLEPLEAFPRLPPHTLLMYRWAPWLDRDVIVGGLADGVSSISRCLAHHHASVLLLCHSAGGVVCAWAAQRIVASAEVPVTIITVASPLAGSVSRKRRENDRAEATFMLDLGSGIEGYPAAAPGVRVLHLRTSAKSDRVMEPGSDGHLPNDPKVGVAGAEQRDLPDTLGHSEALGWVVDRLVEAGGDPAAAKW